MNILITICARGGSNKKIKPIKGKPLICYTLNVIKELKYKKAFKNCDIVKPSDYIREQEFIKHFN
tara:strand:- start:625 stop:819 length:195 start_codon:yes stop_codon:yes gene_type:complete